MSYRSWMSTLGILAATAGFLGVLQRNRAALAGPTVQIIAPVSSFKLRQGRTMPVRVRVQPGGRPLQHWTLRLLGPQESSEELVSGTQPVNTAAVAQVGADGLTAGETYTLSLDATDVDDTSASVQVSFLVPDPQYTLIPLEPGNTSKPVFVGLSVDGSGNLVAMGGGRVGDIQLLDAAANTVRPLHVNLQGSNNYRLSKDGRRLVFGGIFSDANFLRAFGILNLASGAITQGPASAATDFFSTDPAGRWIAFQSNVNLDPGVGVPPGTLQYFLYDDVTKEVRQLTSDPSSIIYNDNSLSCPAVFGTTPLISIDASRVVLITSATLGLVPPDAAQRCHVLAYDVATRTIQHVAALAPGAVLDSPVVSDDARLLSFPIGQTVPPEIRRDFGALMDLTNGNLIDPIGGISEFPSFDSAVTGDGSTVVLSTEADVDPRVGNSDHNMELVSYELSTGRFNQISETVDGIGRFPGGCQRYNPQMSTDGHVVVFEFMLYSVERCQLDGPQRNEVDGFVFRNVRAVRKRAGNRPPILQPIPAARVVPGDTLTMEFAATDADGDPVTFFAQLVDGTDVPPGAAIEDHHNGTATFTWQTTVDQIGVYRLRVAAFDEGGGEAIQENSIAVCRSIVHDGTLGGVLSVLFDDTLPALCHDADLNDDRIVSAADVIAAEVQ